jgi:hypothetical protein
MLLRESFQKLYNKHKEQEFWEKQRYFLL